MSRLRTVAIGTAGGLLAAWIGWGLYTSRETESVPYEVVDSVDSIEIRQYPQALLVETTAANERTAFGRLFRYIDGENVSGSNISMTAPVRTRDGDTALARPDSASERDTGDGLSIDMTAPVRTRESDGETTMAFYLPPDYDTESAPLPTNSTVRLVVEPPRTFAVYDFSWFASDGRVEQARRRLLETLDEAGIQPQGEPVLLRYDAPWTPPFMRTNEVAVEMSADDL